MAEDIVWLSSNPIVAEVDNDGNVLALNRGEAIISATSGPYSNDCTVVVTENVTTVIDEIITNDSSLVDIFNIQGLCIKRNVSPEVINSLPSGLYIINGQ